MAWRGHRYYDPEEKVRRLNLGFRAVSRRIERLARLRRLLRQASWVALAAIIGSAAAWAVMGPPPWTAWMTLKHLASAPSCDAARFMGLAPAQRGQPGYWPKHDEDNDGIACEPWPRY